MPAVITAKEVEDMIAKGGDPKSLPADAILTPSAKDAIRDYANARRGPANAGAASSGPTKPLNSKSSKAELEAYFNSSFAHALKEQLCDIGRRLWQREYVDGNGGNIAIRVGEDIAICTPTLVSKGFMKPEDMCLVDFEGNQLAGTKKRTSEILTQGGSHPHRRGGRCELGFLRRGILRHAARYRRDQPNRPGLYGAVQPDWRRHSAPGVVPVGSEGGAPAPADVRRRPDRGPLAALFLSFGQSQYGESGRSRPGSALDGDQGHHLGARHLAPRYASRAGC